jgi:hypothetical protein
MASRPQVNAQSGITSLGIIIITAGTPQQIAPAIARSNSTYTLTARQIGFSVTSASTGEVYVNYGNYPGLDVNATTLIIQHGTSQSLPIGTVSTDGLIDVLKFWIDGSHTGDVVAIYALDASC